MDEFLYINENSNSESEDFIDGLLDESITCKKLLEKKYYI